MNTIFDPRIPILGYSLEMVSFTKSLNNPATYRTVGIVRA